MEADAGTFSPYGLTFSGDNRLAQCIVNEVLKSLKCINSSRLILSEEGSDIDVLMKEGVPGSSLDTANERYFDFHHTNGDTMSVLNTKDLDLSTAVWAVTSYAFAALDHNLPR